MLEPALHASGAAAERLERVRRANGVVITTGQQPGLFGGPVYTWSKAMSALALANAIEAETGVPCAPVFWAATDDADFVEASFTVLAVNGGAEVLRSPNAPEAGTPMSLAPVGHLAQELARLRAAAGGGADTRALQAVEQAYGNPDVTVGGAYIALLRDLLGPLGVTVLDAGSDAVRLAGDSVLRRALACAPLMERALQERRSDMAQHGFTPQVEYVPGLSLVFERDGAIKRRIAVGEAARCSDDAQCVLSPNVLLRPVMEAAILPTIAYVGGPGEVAYFAQVGAVADVLAEEQPLVVPRWSCTLIEPRIQSMLDEFDVTPDALAQPDQLETRVARQAMSADTAGTLEGLRRAVDSATERLAGEADSMGLGAALKGAGHTLQHRVDRLERRLVAGIKRRERDRMRDISTLRAALYPMGISARNAHSTCFPH